MMALEFSEWVLLAGPTGVFTGSVGAYIALQRRGVGKRARLRDLVAVSRRDWIHIAIIDAVYGIMLGLALPVTGVSNPEELIQWANDHKTMAYAIIGAGGPIWGVGVLDRASRWIGRQSSAVEASDAQTSDVGTRVGSYRSELLARVIDAGTSLEEAAWTAESVHLRRELKTLLANPDARREFRALSIRFLEGRKPLSDYLSARLDELRDSDVELFRKESAMALVDLLLEDQLVSPLESLLRAAKAGTFSA